MSNTPSICLALFGLALLPAAAQLSFEKQSLEVTAKPDQEVFTVEFPFTVKGEKPVTIAEYDAPCSCLEARISDNGRLTWQPGEKGSVQGVFKMGNFKGTADKMIVLRMEGETSPSVKLTVRVHVPELVVIEPKTLFWGQGDKVTPQTFKLKVQHDKPIHILDTSGTNDTFPFEVKTIKDGWEYEIVVTPTSLAERAFGMIRIRTDAEYAQHVSYQAFAVVRKTSLGEENGGVENK